MADKQSIFNFGSYFGDPDLQNLLQRVDALNTSLDKKVNQDPDYAKVTDRTLQDVISLISSEEEIPRSVEGTSSESVQDLLKNLAVPIQRQNRYRVYDELYSSVQLIKRIVRVYSDNILQKDPVTGNCLTLLESKNKQATNYISDLKDYTNTIIKHFKLDDKLSDHILQDLLRYGDSYIELIDLKKDIFNLPDVNKGKNRANVTNTDNDVSVLTESDVQYFNKRLKTLGSNSKEQLLNEAIDKFLDTHFDIIQLNETNISPDLFELITEDNTSTDFINSLKTKSEKKYTKDDKMNLKQFKAAYLNRFLMRVHSPKKIVNLTTVHNNSVLGYVEVREKESVEKVPGVGLQFATVLKQISTINKDKTEDISGTTRKMVSRLIKKIIEKSGIVKQHTEANATKENIKQINREFEKQLHEKIGDDLFYLIKRLYNESDQEGGPTNMKMEIRYIPADNMIHLCLNPIEFKPYGTSIIDPLIYPAKLYLLTQLTNMVIKLSRASLIRKWTKFLLSSYIVIYIK